MSAWIDHCVAELASLATWGYHAGGPAASEPTALAALALAAHGRDDAMRAAGWLQAAQSEDGSVGVSREQKSPGWPTSLAVLAWCGVSAKSSMPTNQKHLSGPSLALERCRSRAIDWLLATKGEIVTETEPLSHDRMLVGWPWIEGTHSWVEPTALSVLALKATGHREHPRTREAVRLLVDRLLPTGGCNYGNTFVLGQKLLPHVQPTGLCLMALADERINDPRMARSINYLHQSLVDGVAATSLCYGLLGLAAHSEQPKQTTQWLEAAYQRVNRRDRSSHKLSLLMLAAMGADCPLIALSRRAGT
jgi:hypothetical protein